MTDETGGALSVQTYKLIDLYTHEMNQTKMWWTWSTKIFLRSKQSKNATTNKDEYWTQQTSSQASNLSLAKIITVMTFSQDV